MGENVCEAPTAFTVDFTYPVNSSLPAASAMVVNGTAADAFLVLDDDSIEFKFDTSPVIEEGLQTISFAADSVKRLSDGAGIAAYSSTFRHDVVRLAVAATDPAPGAAFTLQELTSPEPANVWAALQTDVLTADFTLPVGSRNDALALTITQDDPQLSDLKIGLRRDTDAWRYQVASLFRRAGEKDTRESLLPETLDGNSESMWGL